MSTQRPIRLLAFDNVQTPDLARLPDAVGSGFRAPALSFRSSASLPPMSILSLLRRSRSFSVAPMLLAPGLLASCGRPMTTTAAFDATPVAAVSSAGRRTERGAEWPAYAHDAAGTKYSPATQITRKNVGRLVPVWTYRTGDFARGGGTVRD